MNPWMLLMVRRIRYWCDFTSIKLSIITLRLKLLFMQIDLSILITLKKLLMKLNGEEP